MTVLSAINVAMVLVFSLMLLVLVSAPAAPLGPVITGGSSTTLVMVTVKVCEETLPLVSVARTITT